LVAFDFYLHSLHLFAIRYSEFMGILAPAFLIGKAPVQVWRPREIHETVSL
jgi:hypothetical protein